MNLPALHGATDAASTQRSTPTPPSDHSTEASFAHIFLDPKVKQEAYLSLRNPGQDPKTEGVKDSADQEAALPENTEVEASTPQHAHHAHTNKMPPEVGMPGNETLPPDTRHRSEVDPKIATDAFPTTTFGPTSKITTGHKHTSETSNASIEAVPGHMSRSSSLHAAAGSEEAGLNEITPRQLNSAVDTWATRAGVGTDLASADATPTAEKRGTSPKSAAADTGVHHSAHTGAKNPLVPPDGSTLASTTAKTTNAAPDLGNSNAGIKLPAGLFNSGANVPIENMADTAKTAAPSAGPSVATPRISDVNVTTLGTVTNPLQTATSQPVTTKSVAPNADATSQNQIRVSTIGSNPQPLDTLGSAPQNEPFPKLDTAGTSPKAFATMSPIERHLTGNSATLLDRPANTRGENAVAPANTQLSMPRAAPDQAIADAQGQTSARHPATYSASASVTEITASSANSTSAVATTRIDTGGTAATPRIVTADIAPRSAGRSEPSQSNSTQIKPDDHSVLIKASTQAPDLSPPKTMQATFAGHPTLETAPLVSSEVTASSDEVSWEIRTPTTLNAQTAQPQILRADTPQHVAQQIAEAVHRTPDKPIELALNPIELGRVRMILSPSETGMTVSILADRPETLDLMRRNIDDLARSFSDLGYDDLSFEFGTGDQSDAWANDQAEPGEPTRDSDEPIASDAAEPTLTPLTVAPDGIDIRY